MSMSTQTFNTLRQGNIWQGPSSTAPLFKAGDAVVFVNTYNEPLWSNGNTPLSVAVGAKGYVVQKNINFGDILASGNIGIEFGTGTAQRSQMPFDFGNSYKIRLLNGQEINNVPESVLSPTIIGNEVWNSIPPTQKLIIAAVAAFILYKLLN